MDPNYFTVQKSLLVVDLTVMLFHLAQYTAYKCKLHSHYHKCNCCSHHNSFFHQHISGCLRLIKKLYCFGKNWVFDSLSVLIFNSPATIIATKQRPKNNFTKHLFIIIKNFIVQSLLIDWINIWMIIPFIQIKYEVEVSNNV